MKKYIKEIKLEIFLQILCSAIESLALAGLAYLPKVLFDSLAASTNNRLIFVIITEFCILSLVLVVACYLGMKFTWRYTVKFENSVKKDYFNAIIQYDDITFYQRNVSDYISIQSNDIMQIEQDYLTPLISAINQIIKVIIFGLVMFLGIDWRIASIVFISSIITAILPKYTGKSTSLKRFAFVESLGKYTDVIYVLQKNHIFSTNYSNNVTMFHSYKDSSDKLMSELCLSEELINKIKTQDNSTGLSGGEQQIVAYIRARNSETPILIMDEPFSAVDKHLKQILMKDIASLQNKTVIMITHDIDESLDYFDEIIKINNGCIIK